MFFLDTCYQFWQINDFHPRKTWLFKNAALKTAMVPMRSHRRWIYSLWHPVAPPRRLVRTETRGASKAPPPTIASPIVSILHFAFCILHSVGGCGLRAANDRPYDFPACHSERRRGEHCSSAASPVLSFCTLHSAFCTPSAGVGRGRLMTAPTGGC